MVMIIVNIIVICFKYIDLIIVDEIDRLKVQHLEQLRAIYDEHNLARYLLVCQV